MNANATTEKGTWLRAQIAGYTKTTWHWQRVMGERRTPRYSHEASARILARWRRLARVTRARAQHPPHLSALLCIHRYEGSWSDSGAPFWGGLQMDYGFQASYGSYLLRTKGTADRWTPLEQIWVAEKAVRSRGFYPWPNTARYCGLI